MSEPFPIAMHTLRAAVANTPRATDQEMRDAMHRAGRISGLLGAVEDIEAINPAHRQEWARGFTAGQQERMGETP
jgi:hypothetical protein